MAILRFSLIKSNKAKEKKDRAVGMVRGWRPPIAAGKIDPLRLVLCMVLSLPITADKILVGHMGDRPKDPVALKTLRR